MSESNQYGCWISPPIYHSDRLTLRQKAIWGRSEAISGDDGYCTAWNEFFAEEFNVSLRTIRRDLEQMENLGFIRRVEIRDYTENDEVDERRIYPIRNNQDGGSPDNDVPTPPDTDDRTPPDTDVRYSNSGKSNSGKSKSNSDSAPHNENDDLFQEGDAPTEATKYLIEKITEYNPKTPTPEFGTETFQKWATTMDRLNRLGPVGGDEGFSWDRIKSIIDFVFNDSEFWPQNVQSPSGLRRNIIKIENEMDSDSEGSAEVPDPGDIEGTYRDQQEKMVGHLYPQSDDPVICFKTHCRKLREVGCKEEMISPVMEAHVEEHGHLDTGSLHETFQSIESMASLQEV